LRTELQTVVRACLCAVPFVLTQIGGSFAGQTTDPPDVRSGISLSPSVVMLSGQLGQAHRQTLRLTNHTSRELAFRLEAQDVVADEGHRTFLAAGERQGSIAATAVFSSKDVIIAPGAVGTVDVTVTTPRTSVIRGVAVIFRGQTIVGSHRGLAMTGSLGALMTFTLSADTRIEGAPPEVSEQTDTSNLALMEWVTNVGTEPVVASGAAALLNESGTLVGKVPVEAQRLMPGERLSFRAEYPDLLGAGRYRAILSLEYDDHARKVLTRTVEFVVAPAGDDRRDADGRPGVRQ
jgi:hypothetical protein